MSGKNNQFLGYITYFKNKIIIFKYNNQTFLREGENIEKNTDIAIRCYKCGKEYNLDMMRMDSNLKNLVCRNCLERKPAEKREQTKIFSQNATEKNQEPSMKEYFCKKCKYNFTRAKHLDISTCPYCGASKSLMSKGSTAKIISDASKMKGDYEF